MYEADFRELPADVVPVLSALLDGARETFGAGLVGLYLYGSLASGDFDVRTSDIDFLIVTENEIDAGQIEALEALHRRLWASGDKWAWKLEGSYIPRRSLRRYNADDPARPGVNEGRFLVERHGSDWIIQRHLIREHSAVVVGPDPRTLIDPVRPDELRGAVSGVMREWWIPMLDDPAFLERDDYQAFAVLTMCRVLYSLEYGDIASKPVSARWAQAALDDRWPGLVDQALAWKPGNRFNRMDDVLGLLRYTAEHLD